jgi:hypothetical protein
MQYTIPLTLDRNDEATGLFSLYTSHGPVVIIFTNPLKFEKFAQASSTKLKSQGQKFGSVEMEASSLADIINKLLAMDPSLADNVNFIPDSDPLFDQLLESYDNL